MSGIYSGQNILTGVGLLGFLKLTTNRIISVNIYDVFACVFALILVLD